MKWLNGCLVLLIVLLALALLTDLGGGAARLPARPAAAVVPLTVAPAAPTIPPTAPAVPATRACRVGERCAAAGVALTVLQVTRLDTIGTWPAAAGHVYLDLLVLVENTGQENTPYNPLYFRLKDGQDYEYDTAITAQSPRLKSGELTPGARARGHVAFEIPRPAAGLVVSYEPEVMFADYPPLRVALE